MIKVKYLRKMQERLKIVSEMLDRPSVEKMLKHRPFNGKSDVHNKLETMRLLFEQDVPALLKELMIGD